MADQPRPTDPRRERARAAGPAVLETAPDGDGGPPGATGGISGTAPAASAEASAEAAAAAPPGHHRRTDSADAPADGPAPSGPPPSAVRQGHAAAPAADLEPDVPAEPSAADVRDSIGVLPGHRVRARLARLAGARQVGGVDPVLEPLLTAVRDHRPKADLRLIARAYEVAEEAHGSQQRRSGDPYITHPVAVTTILAELGATTPMLVAGLLHDTVEDTPLTLEAVTREFGPEVAGLVDGVTKLDKVKYGASAQAETIRKMVVAMARDPRVLVIKLSDRLHNMRTLRYLPPEKQERIARETLEIFAPLAHRLGMNTMKWELEDLSFALLYPKRYHEIVRLVAERAPSRDTYLARVIEQVADELRAAKIKAQVTGRPKHYWSIYQKMIVRGRDFDDIYDLIGLRVLVESLRDCYAALGTIHATWSPVPGRFKDYIAMPKFNLYQSLHTTVIGPEAKPVEIQIRSTAMHRRAEYGIAAHWKYKEDPGSDGRHARGRGEEAGDTLVWLKQILDWQRETEDPGEFLDTLRYDLKSSEVYVFTPKGDVLALPSGSTPVDYAYAVHTEVGHRCIGARVNGKLVPLESTLANGDTVEIFTSKAATAGPSRDWLAFVKSPRARNKIRQWFARERREDAIEVGKDAISRAMRKHGLPLQRLLSGDVLATLAHEMHYADVAALYAAVGENNISAQAVVSRLLHSLGGEEGASDDLAEATTTPERARRRSAAADPGVTVKGASDVWVKLAKCCTPVPGDDIVGFVTRGAGVSVHRADCVNVGALSGTPERMVEVTWAPTAGSVFLVNIQVEALDRTRLLSDVTRVLSDEKVNILSASVTTSRDRVAISRFTFEMGDPQHLRHLLKAVRGVAGVYDAYRITSG